MSDERSRAAKSGGFRIEPTLRTTTNAPSVDKLNGPTVQFGGQFGEGTTINVEKTFFKDSETGELYTGTTIGAKENLMVPFPGEIHATVTNTWTLFKINIREIMNFIENY
jgi:hypothetical protein